MHPLPQALVNQAQRRIAALPLPCLVELPGGQRIGSPHAKLTFIIRDIAALIHFAQGSIGRLAEDYVDGRLGIVGELRDMMATAPKLLGQDPALGAPSSIHRWMQEIRYALWELARHQRHRDASQIRAHYDISDDFYALWLDPKRVYSCAYFASSNMTLERAQEAKMDHICRKLMLKPGERVLDIGAGWGALPMWAAMHYGVEATGITLSPTQHAYANRAIVDGHFGSRVHMLLQDYRDVDETRPYDKVASVGMCEHVGRKNLKLYFGKIYRLLKPGGLALNHSITRSGRYNTEFGGGISDFIEHHIFPGGQLVPLSVMLSAQSRAKLETLDAECLRPHYARTLWCWSDALETHVEQAEHILGANAESVIRAYRLYLAGSAMAFEQGWISLFQVLLARAGNQMATTYPYNRSYMYSY